MTQTVPRPGHILFFGYTSSTEAALVELEDEIERYGITILTREKIPETPGVTRLPIDYLNVSLLRDHRVGLDSASACVVFAEARKGGITEREADMHTVLTVYNIRKERPDVPLIAEIMDRENTSFIDELGCSDVVYKETIDRNLITSCILLPNTSPLFYDLLTVTGKTIKTTSLAKLGMPREGVTYRDVRLHGLANDLTFLGFIDGTLAAELTPPNDTIVRPHYQLVYIE